MFYCTKLLKQKEAEQYNEPVFYLPIEMIKLHIVRLLSPGKL